MAITPNEAAAALSDIENTTRRGMTLRGYRVAGPILMVWGLIWAVGYVAMGVLPVERWGPVWFILDFVGATVTIIMTGRGYARRATAVKAAVPAGLPWKLALGMVGTAAFVLGVVAIFPQGETAAYLALPGLVTGMIYMSIGLWSGLRYALIGLAVFAATLVGFFVFRSDLAFWMAGVGGGALFLSGLWLRKA